MPEARRARIVHLITRLELGGAQQNTLYCVAHHDRARFSVGLWAGAGGRLDAQARAIPDADVRIVPWISHPISPVKDLRAVARLARELSGVDLLHTHSSKAGMLGRAAARLAGVPAVVHTVHGWSFHRFQPAPARRLYVALERAAARWCDRLVCVSAADRAAGLALGIGAESQYRIVRSGIDPLAFAPSAAARASARGALSLGPGDVVVGTVANFKPQKAPLDFVETARRALVEDPRLRFVFVGDGEERGRVERAIAGAGLSRAILLLGWRDDVAELLSAMDVFLLTSRFEGLPRAVLQAMAAEVPVVATDTGGTAEVVDDGRSGFLVPPADPAAAAAAVLKLTGDAALRRRMGEAGRRRLGAEFDIRVMVRELEGIYDELLLRQGPGRGATSLSHLGAVAAKN